VFDIQRMSVWDCGIFFWRLGFWETDNIGRPLRFVQIGVPHGGFGLRSFCFRYPEDVNVGFGLYT
jgi:hypothetical protein